MDASEYKQQRPEVAYLNPVSFASILWCGTAKQLWCNFEFLVGNMTLFSTNFVLIPTAKSTEV